MEGIVPERELEERSLRSSGQEKCTKEDWEANRDVKETKDATDVGIVPEIRLDEAELNKRKSCQQRKYASWKESNK